MRMNGSEGNEIGLTVERLSCGPCVCVLARVFEKRFCLLCFRVQPFFSFRKNCLRIKCLRFRLQGVEFPGCCCRVSTKGVE